jgi:hypothetical protein
MPYIASMRFSTGFALLLCLVTSAFATAQKKQAPPKPPLKFSLYDTQGRLVEAEDYRGAPVLVECGACW